MRAGEQGSMPGALSGGHMNRINMAIAQRLGAFAAREGGQSMVEYGLILALIAVVCIVAVGGIGTGAAAKFASVNAQL